MRGRVRPLTAAAVSVLAVACTSGNDAPRTPESPRPTASTASTPSTAPGATGLENDVVPGTAVVTVGGERHAFVVFECLIGAETGSPNRRLALSASETEPFPEADVVLNVDVLVSSRTGTEDHLISILGFKGSDVGAGDVATPSRGGPAPDDWIHVDEVGRVIRGSGFELRATDPTAASHPAGTLVADCPRRPARPGER